MEVTEMTEDELAAYRKNLELAGESNPDVVDHLIRQVDSEISGRRTEQIRRRVWEILTVVVLLAAWTIVSWLE